MSRLKFEEQFEKKLEGHEVQPSPESWGKLESRLDREDKKSPSTYWWIKIAASVVGVILITSLVFNNTRIQNEPAVVESPSEEIFEEEIRMPRIEKEGIVSEEMEKPQVATVSELIQKERNPKNQLAEIPKIIGFEIQPVPNLVKPTTISKKLDEVIAEVSSKEKNNKVTDAEIDALLAHAAMEISRENSFEYVGNINAEDLLWEVEMELEESFREKIFQLLKEGYLKAKTAVATSDN